jgi:hypothetical protein
MYEWAGRVQVMTAIRRVEPPEHLVVPDTNTLWHEDKAHVVAPAFMEFWSSVAGDFNLSLVVPAAVRGELLFQQTTSALKTLARANSEFARVASIAGVPYTHRVDESRVRRDVESRLDRWAQQCSARIHPTPIGTIDWQSLVDASIWRLPPFLESKDRAEKGFRDALICQTVRDLCASQPADKKIAFITSDQVLRMAIEAVAAEFDHFACYESTTDFHSYLRLTREQLTDQFIKAIRRRASQKFFKEEDPSTLYYREDIRKRLEERFPERFAPPNPADPGYPPELAAGSSVANWARVTFEMSLVAHPAFDRLERSRVFYWKTQITISQVFAPSGDSAVLALSDTARRIRSLVFSVEWRARVKSDGRFHDLEIVDLEFVDRQLVPVSPEELKKRELAR